MKTLIINAHLTYAGWSEGRLNLAFMAVAKTFFRKRRHEVDETFVERGYRPEEEVAKHAADRFLHITRTANSAATTFCRRSGFSTSSGTPDVIHALEDGKRHLEKHCL
jgi:hypothetical protein